MKIKLYKTQKGLLEGVQLCCNLPVVCLCSTNTFLVIA